MTAGAMVLMYSRIRLLDLLSVSRRVSSSSIEHAEQIRMSISSGSSVKDTLSASRRVEAFRQRVSENIVSERTEAGSTQQRRSSRERTSLMLEVAPPESRNRGGRLLKTWMLLLSTAGADGDHCSDSSY